MHVHIFGCFIINYPEQCLAHDRYLINTVSVSNFSLKNCKDALYRLSIQQTKGYNQLTCPGPQAAKLLLASPPLCITRTAPCHLRFENISVFIKWLVLAFLMLIYLYKYLKQEKNHILQLIQFSSVTQSCPTLCNPMNCITPGLPVHHQLLKYTQTNVHWVMVGDAIQSSHPLLSPSPPALNLSQHQGLFKWVSSSHQVVKILEFQLQHQSFQLTLRTDLL